MSRERTRVAGPEDATEILSIYGPLVRDTAISFESTPPSVEELRERITRTLEAFPWLIHERDGEVLGYAYAGPLRARPAYRWSVEVSVYVKTGARAHGIGRALGSEIIELLTRQGFVNAFGVVTLPNPASVRLMQALGFVHVGVMRQAGYKLGTWHDVGWWQRALNDHSDEPQEPVAFSQLDG